jgi:hypothetical protein
MRLQRGIIVPSELRTKQDSLTLGRGINSTAQDAFWSVGIAYNAMHGTLGVGAQPVINGQTAREEEGEPEFQRERTVAFKREPTYFSGQAGVSAKRYRSDSLIG